MSMCSWSRLHMHVTDSQYTITLDSIKSIVYKKASQKSRVTYVRALVKFWMIRRLSGGSSGIASSWSASQSRRLTASAQL